MKSIFEKPEISQFITLCFSANIGIIGTIIAIVILLFLIKIKCFRLL